MATGLNFGSPVTASAPRLGVWRAADTALHNTFNFHISTSCVDLSVNF